VLSALAVMVEEVCTCEGTCFKGD